MAREFRAAARVRCWGTLILVLGALVGAPAHADLYAGLRAFKQHDYAPAFREFLALAQLGQGFSQLDVAYMYVAGYGTARSAASAYAWARLAGANGEAAGKTLAAQLQPLLRAADRQAAARIEARYGEVALHRRLLPVVVDRCGHAGAVSGMDCLFVTHESPACNPVHFDKYEYPAMEGYFENMQSRVVVQFTLMPDGTARLPHVVFGLPEPGFRSAVRMTILRSKFPRRSGSAGPTQCDMDISFVERDIEGMSAYHRLDRHLLRMRRRAASADPSAEAAYGMLLAGLPQVSMQRGRDFLVWLVKAAQAGVPFAQYEVGESLLAGWGCQPDRAKGLRWLRLAAAGHDPHAEAALAIRRLHGTLTRSAVAKARPWLVAAVAGHDQLAAVYFSALLAAAPQPRLRDPQRALRLERQAFANLALDPTGDEIRAAAYAAEGHFKRAVRAEHRAIEHAQRLGWSLAPLRKRLARYRATQEWFGNLLEYRDGSG